MDKENYLEINRESWNRRAEVHVESEFYDIPGFIAGGTSLNPIELEFLTNLEGKKVLHLQCHFGQDTIALNRLGAEVVGVDLSDVSIEKARDLAEKTNSTATFICCDVYDLPNHLNDTFDIVFTSYGTIGWLPDLDKWANVISRFLKPGGSFVFAEFHPVVWMFDDDFSKVGYNYFNSGEIIETESGTYTDRAAEITQTYVCWNHGIAEVLTSLMNNGLALTAFNEYDYSPYDIFRDSYEPSPGQFRVKHLENKIPMVYALTAVKK
jgi:SAM-dependent methyltransferase